MTETATVSAVWGFAPRQSVWTASISSPPTPNWVYKFPNPRTWTDSARRRSLSSSPWMTTRTPLSEENSSSPSPIPEEYKPRWDGLLDRGQAGHSRSTRRESRLESPPSACFRIISCTSIEE
ncbi:hypothetical protein BN903_420 [Halorubrum sp. AJ67]|nr:hypothetical protein BN903_420 [Halorubrum sp. AJ67]